MSRLEVRNVGGLEVGIAVSDDVSDREFETRGYAASLAIAHRAYEIRAGVPAPELRLDRDLSGEFVFVRAVGMARRRGSFRRAWVVREGLSKRSSSRAPNGRLIPPYRLLLVRTLLHVRDCYRWSAPVWVRASLVERVMTMDEVLRAVAQGGRPEKKKGALRDER